MSHVFLVGRNGNISKNRAYYLSNKKEIRRIRHGLYVTASLSDEEVKAVLRRNAIRIAFHFFEDVVCLTHSSAYTLEAVTPENGVPLLFVGGCYSYKDDFGGGFLVVQSQLSEVERVVDPRMYAKKLIRDDFGVMPVYVPVEELLLLQNYERIKEWNEKKFDVGPFIAMTIKRKYDGSEEAFLAELRKMADLTGRDEEFQYARQAVFALRE